MPITYLPPLPAYRIDYPATVPATDHPIPEGMPVQLARASLDDAREMLNCGRCSGDDIRSWFPHWCIGKSSYRVNNGQPQEFVDQRWHEEGGQWMPLWWVIRAY